MISINKVQLCGNLTRDPEIKETANGKLARMSIATNRRYRDRDGQMQDAVQYHDVVVFQERLVSVIESYCEKGTQVLVEGTLEHRSYEDKDGIKRNVSEVVIRPYGGELQLGNKSQNANAGNNRSENNSRDRDDNRGRDENRGRNEHRGGNSNSRNNYDDDMDDDIPF